MGNVFRPVYRELNEEEDAQMSAIKDKAQELYELIVAIQAPDPTKGRYIALAKTSLEESVMWAVKGLTT